MPVKIINREANKITLQIEIELDNNSMLNSEERILTTLNEAGLEATKIALKSFDTDGSPITVGGKILTSKGSEKKKFKHPTEK